VENLPIRHICQVEIRVHDLAAAAAFYRACFDWSVRVVAEDYALVDTGYEPIAALMVSPSPKWPIGVGNYVLVPNCAAAAGYAASLGGQIFIGRTEVPGSGAYSGAIDPFGNELLFWEPAQKWAAKVRGTGENPLVWLEIPAPDLEKGLAYYSRLLRWRFALVPEQPDYAITADGGFPRGIGLVGGQRGGRMRGTMNYIGTPNLDASAARITAHGGTILRGRSELAGEGAFLIFADPQGIRWGLFEEAR
jgi:hypothetical protein